MPSLFVSGQTESAEDIFCAFLIYGNAYIIPVL